MTCQGAATCRRKRLSVRGFTGAIMRALSQTKEGQGAATERRPRTRSVHRVP